MKAMDSAIASIFPGWAARRARARSALAYYDAIKKTRLRPDRDKNATGDQIASMGGAKLRAHARYLERNYDIARGAISRLVQNIIGANGIGIEPRPRNKAGEILDDFAREILLLWDEWCWRPEVTRVCNWPAVQRMLCRAWVRDGDALAQRLIGSIAGLTHSTTVPYSLEMIESDLLPYDYNDETKRIVQGVERNSWGAAAGYWLYKIDPSALTRMPYSTDLKRVPADRMIHVKLTDRMLQARGISIFASVLTRFDDVKDYEESERVAAKVAASMAAYIKKGLPDDYKPENEMDENGNPMPRSMKFRAGMIFDDLRPGEEIGTIDTKRPNPNTENFRKGQLRAAAAGADVSYSSLARDYNGTYSAQRQELVEQWRAYEVLSGEFGSAVVYPVYMDFLAAAILAGALKPPADLDLRTLDDALLVPPQMPWIDPLKEAEAWRLLEASGYASGPEIIRRRGLNPRDVIEEEAAWQRLREKKGLPPAPQGDIGKYDEGLRREAAALF